MTVTSAFTKLRKEPVYQNIKLSVHEAVKSIRNQCGYEAMTRSHITEHKRHSMMG